MEPQKSTRRYWCSFCLVAIKKGICKELNCEVIRTFIDKVLVHKVEKNDGKRVQTIEIYYNGIVKVAIPR